MLQENNGKSGLRSRIDFQHILRELSENRKDPCEVIRELISNSYDANASLIKIFPLLQYQGFIFFDNGCGLNENQKINDRITSYESFFSVGISTKNFGGESIGYKCQGSKLCFDSKKFALITRCSDESDWRWITIDNPKDNLNDDYPLASKRTIHPEEILSKLLLDPDERSLPIIEKLSQEFFRKEFLQGTMIIIQGLNVTDFSTYYGIKSNESKEYSYLKNYILFNTRHGDVRTLRPDKTGFPRKDSLTFEKDRGYKNNCQLFLWLPSDNCMPLFRENLQEVPSGYPYLGKAPKGSTSPVNVTTLLGGRFYSRHAKMIRYEDKYYCLILAVDGNRRSLDEYSELDRRGSKRSGIRLTDQKGTFICSQGVKVCRYEKFYEASELKDYSQLATDDGHRHYTLMINSNFRLVTDRNSLTAEVETTLNNKNFIGEIKKFLDEARENDNVFRELISRLNKEHIADRIEDYTEQLEAKKNNLTHRIRFFVTGIKTTTGDIYPIKEVNPQLEGKVFVEPQLGEEHGVGALYFLFSHLILPDSPYRDFWLRPLTFSGIGIDSITVGNDEKKPFIGCKTIEYKFNFAPDGSSDFNHPLIHTDHIVLWEFKTWPEEGFLVTDAFKYFGEVRFSESLKDIGYEIVNINNREGHFYPVTVKVISLKRLIQQTFECVWITPPPPKDPLSSSRRKGKK